MVRSLFSLSKETVIAKTNVFGHTTFYEPQNPIDKFPTLEDKLPLILLGMVIIGISIFKGLKRYKNINLNVSVLDEKNKKKLKKIYVSTSIDEINEIKNILEKTIREKKFEELK